MLRTTAILACFLIVSAPACAPAQQVDKKVAEWAEQIVLGPEYGSSKIVVRWVRSPSLSIFGGSKEQVAAATKVIAEIESGAKCYEFTLQLGARTDTGDAEGSVVAEAPVPPLDSARVESALAAFRGVQKQVPPMYSALKRDGRPLYELARQGVEVEREARTIDIRRLELVALRDTALDLVCECAKGTYIRVLGEDIARQLGTLGRLTRLRRLWVEPFKGMPMTTLEDALAQAGRVVLPGLR